MTRPRAQSDASTRSRITRINVVAVAVARLLQGSQNTHGVFGDLDVSVAEPRAECAVARTIGTVTKRVWEASFFAQLPLPLVLCDSILCFLLTSNDRQKVDLSLLRWSLMLDGSTSRVVWGVLQGIRHFEE